MPTPKKNITPRKKSVLPAKYREFIVDKPIAYCPKCLLYVRDVDKSVVCKPCQAYWHHACAEATLQDIEEEWDGISFVCQKHREEQNQMVLIPVSEIDEFINSQEENRNTLDDNEIKITTVKINPYVLNVQAKIKDKLSKMDSAFKITPRDNNRQFYFTMSTPTYHLVLENLVQFGNDIGLEVKRNDEDITKQMVKTQFTLVVRTTDGMCTPISLTGYHTKNSMLAQLMGNVCVPTFGRLYPISAAPSFRKALF